jgi:ketosteroid isomerase-like protein
LKESLEVFDYETFVARYEQAWKDKDPVAFEALWDPDGVLHHPTVDRAVRGQAGRAAFQRVTFATVPDLVWRLESWGAHGEHLLVEWTCTATVGSSDLRWNGVDRFVVRNGRIVEEVVYCDTQPLLAALDPSARRPTLMSLGE